MTSSDFWKYVHHHFHFQSSTSVRKLKSECSEITWRHIQRCFSVTAHECAGGLDTLNLWSGPGRHRYVVGVFSVSFWAPTRGWPFCAVVPRGRPIQSPFTTHWGYGRSILIINPGVPTVVRDLTNYRTHEIQNLWNSNNKVVWLSYFYSC